MFFINNIGFNIKYLNKEKIYNEPVEEIYDNFLKTYTDISNDKILSLDDDIKKEIVNFVYLKINFNDENCFINYLIKTANTINTDIRFFMIQLLHLKNYNFGEMYEWNFDKLFHVFYMEALNDKKIKKIFYDNVSAFFNEDETKIKEYIVKLFGPDFLEENNNLNLSEQEELINKLNNL